MNDPNNRQLVVRSPGTCQLATAERPHIVQAPAGYRPSGQPCWTQSGPQSGPQSDLDAEVEQRRLREEYDLRLELLQTQCRLERLQRAKSTNIRVSDKGAVSVYGLGKYPVTLYADQWRMLLAQAELIEQFLIDHEDELAQRQG